MVVLCRPSYAGEGIASEAAADVTREGACAKPSRLSSASHEYLPIEVGVDVDNEIPSVIARDGVGGVEEFRTSKAFH